MFGIDMLMVQTALQNEIVLGMFMLSILGSIVFLFRGLFGGLWNIFVRQITVETKITSQDDETFKNLTRWLSNVPGLQQRLRSFRVGVYTENNQPQFYTYPGEGNHFFFHNKKPYLAHLTIETDKNNVKEIFDIKTIGRSNVSFTEMINSFVKGNTEDCVKVYSYSYGWSLAATRKHRNWNSVFYNDNIKEDILEDINAFIDNEEWYFEHGIPYHRGYLLEGPPGTGKTSLIHALASQLKYNIYTIDLNAMNDADDLISAMRSAPRESLLVIEDIDSFESAMNREKDEDDNTLSINLSKFTLSSLLNSLDGLCSVEGRMIFMTTNYPDKLDGALLRPGRVDKRFHIDVPSDRIIADMYRHFMKTDVGVDDFVEANRGESTSAIQGVLFDIATK